MLGWVAAVSATESPSQLRPALIHKMWTTVSGASVVGDTAFLPVRCLRRSFTLNATSEMRVFCICLDTSRPMLVLPSFTITPGDRAWFARCRRAWDLGARARRNLEHMAPVQPDPLGHAFRRALAVYYYPG